MQNIDLKKKKRTIQAPVAQASNLSYLGGKDQKDCGSKPAWANSSRDPTSKIPNTKRAGVVA
jgi:hypothetical protein